MIELTQFSTSDINTTLLLEGAGRIVFVIVLAFIAVEVVRRAVSPVIRVAIREHMTGAPEVEVQKRIATLSGVIYRTFVLLVVTMAVLTILPEFGIEAGPLIAGLGLIGLAVGFGAQHLVKDVINGIEILMENQYAQGDYVKLGAVSGIVEDINLRRTVLRDFDGNVHFVSHGAIDVTSNYTRGQSRVNFTIVVGYTADLDRVFAVIDAVGQEMATDQTYGKYVVEAPRAVGVDKLGEATVDVRVSGATTPGDQWTVGGELRRRLKRAFDAEGIRVRDLPPAPPSATT